MKHVLIETDLATQIPPHKRKVVVRAGWKAAVPEITVEEAAVKELAEKLRCPEAEARRLHQQIYERGFLHSLRFSLAGQMRRFAKHYPQMIARDGELRGFDPERAQTLFTPTQNTGRRGVKEAMLLFAEMAQASSTS